MKIFPSCIWVKTTPKAFNSTSSVSGLNAPKVHRWSSRITPIEYVQVMRDLTYKKVPIAIIDQQVRRLGNKEVVSVKVVWRSQQLEEVGWEVEEAIKFKFPYLFQWDVGGDNVELRIK